MLRLNTKIFSKDVPTTKEVITAVTECGKTGLLIQDYLNGKPVNNKGVVVSYAKLDGAILTYKYKNETVYLEKSTISAFSSMLEHAVVFDDYGGSIEKFAEAMNSFE